MNINVEVLFRKMHGLSWSEFNTFLEKFKTEKLCDFPFVFGQEKSKDDAESGIARLPREDFTIFGINTKEPFDLVRCEKCNCLYRPQNVIQHCKHHRKISSKQDKIVSIDSTTTPTKAQKKEMQKVTALSPLDNLMSTDVSSDTDMLYDHGKVSKVCDNDLETCNDIALPALPWPEFPQFVEKFKPKILKLPILKRKQKVKDGIASLSRKDFCTFGISPKNENFDFVRCDKCDKFYRVQALNQHSEFHRMVTVKLEKMDSPESISSCSVSSTPTKAQKKEIPKITKKFVLSPPETIAFTEISSDADMLSPGGISNLSDASNISNGVKTDDFLNTVPSNLSLPLTFTSIKSKHSLQDKTKKTKESKKTSSSSRIKEYDPDKHCGVRTEKNGHQPCLRSLTCRSHLIDLRRKVPGRCKSFNQLLKEHKLLSKVKNPKKKGKDTKESEFIMPAHIVIKHDPILPSSPPAQVFIPPSLVQNDDPMLVDEKLDILLPHQDSCKVYIEQKPIIVQDITTRVRKSKNIPQPLTEITGGLVRYDNQIFTNCNEAYWMKLFRSSVIQSSENSVNSLKKSLYPHHFFVSQVSQERQMNGTLFVPNLLTNNYQHGSFNAFKEHNIAKTIASFGSNLRNFP